MDEDRRVDEMQVELNDQADRRQEDAEDAEIDRRSRVTGVNISVDRTPNGIVISG